jgi:hypothetical protein
VQNRQLYNQKRPPGRPNLGKTGTIAQRKVDVYLPTEELVDEWRKAAERAGNSLSKYVIEIVERYRNNLPPEVQVSSEEEGRVKDLEKDLAVLQLRFETLNHAFQKQEVELSGLSASYSKAAREVIDIETTRKILAALIADDGAGVVVDELSERIGISIEDEVNLEKFRRASGFLLDVGLIEFYGMEYRWKHGSAKGKPKLSPEARRKRVALKHGKHA